MSDLTKSVRPNPHGNTVQVLPFGFPNRLLHYESIILHCYDPRRFKQKTGLRRGEESMVNAAEIGFELDNFSLQLELKMKY